MCRDLPRCTASTLICHYAPKLLADTFVLSSALQTAPRKNVLNAEAAKAGDNSNEDDDPSETMSTSEEGSGEEDEEDDASQVAKARTFAAALKSSGSNPLHFNLDVAFLKRHQAVCCLLCRSPGLYDLTFQCSLSIQGRTQHPMI